MSQHHYGKYIHHIRQRNHDASSFRGFSWYQKAIKEISEGPKNTSPQALPSAGTKSPSLMAERRDRKALCFVIRSIIPEAKTCTCLDKEKAIGKPWLGGSTCTNHG
jgi:hypothetical protein